MDSSFESLEASDIKDTLSFDMLCSSSMRWSLIEVRLGRIDSLIFESMYWRWRVVKECLVEEDGGCFIFFKILASEGLSFLFEPRSLPARLVVRMLLAFFPLRLIVVMAIVLSLIARL